MKIKSSILGILIVLIIFSGIAGSAALNFWKTETDKIPAKITSGDAVGKYNPDDIRGSYTFEDISSLFNIPLEKLADAFRLSDEQDPASYRNSSLEENYGFLESFGTEIGNTSVKLFVAFYNDLPMDLSEDIYLPIEAANIIQQHTQLNDERSAYLETHTLDIDLLTSTTASVIKGDSAQTDLASEEHSEDEDNFIKGKTTFQEVISWGISQVEIEQVLGMPMPNPLTLIRDFCLEHELEFSLIREELQVKVDVIYKN